MEEQENIILGNIRTMLKDKSSTEYPENTDPYSTISFKEARFADLARATGIDKVRPAYTLEVLEKRTIAKRRRYIMLLWPRMYTEITEKGEEKIKEIIGSLSRLK